MSKVTNALRRAELDRQMGAGNGTSNLPGYLRAIRDELKEEIRLAEQAFIRRSAPAIEGPSALPEPAPASAVESRATGHQTASGTALTTGASVVEGPAAAPTDRVVGGPASWDEVIESVRTQLGECEQHAARQTGDQVHLRAQLAASEQLLARIEQERTVLRQRLEQAAHASEAIEQTKAAFIRRLEALRECQVLSHACRMAERELEANGLLITHATQSQQRVTEELAHYQERSDVLQHQVNQLRFQLAKALAVTGTTEQDRNEPLGRS
jgi:hypothetical protein